jgi:hypothetical protein
MTIDEVHILRTSTTPEILLNPKGIIKIKGRAIQEYMPEFYQQIMNWIDGYLLNPAELTEVTIALEYLNTYNTKILTSIFQKISQIVLHEKKLAIYWYYEDDDEDLFERAQYVSSIINLPIKFIVTKNITGF